MSSSGTGARSAAQGGTGHVLGYAPKQRRLRRLVGAAAVLLLFSIAAVLALRFGPRLYERWEYSSQWNRALGCQLPSGTVVYEEDPSRAQALLKSADYHTPAKLLLGIGWYPKPPAWWSPPACYTPRSLNRILPLERDAVVWIHNRISPAGVRVLVIVRCAGFDFAPGGHPVGLQGRPYSRGTFQSGIVLERARVDETVVLQLKSARDHFRVLAGRPDPADPAHFTLPYEINERGGIIDGWVRDKAGTTATWIELGGRKRVKCDYAPSYCPTLRRKRLPRRMPSSLSFPRPIGDMLPS
jgi:hypothetical protein